MDEKEFREVERDSTNLQTQIELLKNRQPDCTKNKEMYDNEFSKYCVDVQDMLNANNHERYILKRYLFSKEKIETLRRILDALIKVRNENCSLLGTRLFEYSTRILWKLVTLRGEVETDKSQFFDSLEMIANRLEANNSTLNELFQSTHDWEVVNPSKKRCKKCSRELMIEQTESEFSTEKMEMSSIDEEHKREIQRIRDSEIF